MSRSASAKWLTGAVPASHVVIDGSNIATEGRSSPSLRQLDEAVRQFQEEFPGAEPVVVVDATFGHRIDPSERKAFDEAVSHGELVSPPAGAIGRGDAFVLRIAERVGGQVLSNDSFQEFHAEHPWLFDDGRLIGGKPVPGVGWIFTPRRPVRGPRDRDGRAESKGRTGGKSAAASSGPRRRRRGRSAAVLEAVEAAAAAATEAAASRESPPVAEEQPAAPKRARRSRGGSRRRPSTGDPTVAAAIEVAKEEAIGSGSPEPGKRVRASDVAGATGGPQAVNEPLTFVRFITEHPIGDEVDGVVSTFVSHGAMVDVGDMHCYVPLSGLAVPPPKSARVVLKKGERRAFVVVCLDPPRRGAQLALAELRGQLDVDLPAPSRRRAGSRGRTTREGGEPKGQKPAKVAKTGKPVKATATKKPVPAVKGKKAAKAVKARKPATSPKAAKAREAPKAANASPAPRPSDNFSKTSATAGQREGRASTTKLSASTAKRASKATKAARKRASGGDKRAK
jgi:hypothetical protein